MLVERRQEFSFLKTVEHTFHIPFWDTCLQKSLVRHCFVVLQCNTLFTRFLSAGFLKTQSSTQGSIKLDDKDSLRKAVESLFNKLYGTVMKNMYMYVSYYAL